MSAELLVAILVVVWVGIGLLLAVLMGRGGHEAYSWFVLGAVFGPLAIVLAADARRHHVGQDTTERWLGVDGTGTIDVVVGIDGSPESQDAARGVVELFGAALGRLALVAVVPFDATHETEREARGQLIGVALEAGDLALTFHTIHGRPPTALQEFATSGGYSVLAIGARGAGVSRALLGSVASELSRGCRVPVLLFSHGARGGGSRGPTHVSAEKAHSLDR